MRINLSDIHCPKPLMKLNRLFDPSLAQPCDSVLPGVFYEMPPYAPGWVL